MRTLQRVICLLPCAAMFAAAQPLTAQTIRGAVVAASGEPVPHALVTIHASTEPKPVSVLTDSAGAFSVRLTKGAQVQLGVSAAGYEGGPRGEFAIAAGEVVNVRIIAAVQPVQIARLEVTRGSRRISARSHCGVFSRESIGVKESGRGASSRTKTRHWPMRLR